MLSSFSIQDDDHLAAADSMHKSASLVSNLSVWPHITQCPPLVSSYTVLLGCTGIEAAEGSSVSETQIDFTLYTDGVSNMIPVLEKKRDRTTKIVCLNINIWLLYDM